jgi:hypothetical protein
VPLEDSYTEVIQYQFHEWYRLYWIAEATNQIYEYINKINEYINDTGFTESLKQPLKF